VKVGQYTFVIKDSSPTYGYILEGPNGFVKRLTSGPFKGTKTLTLKLEKGKYRYYPQPTKGKTPVSAFLVS
jgi:hypothetical protein